MTEGLASIEGMIPALRRYARALLRDRAAGDDLVQDALERVVARWHQRRPGGDVRAWAFAIVHNLAIDRMRRSRRRGRHVPIEEADGAALAAPATQDQGLLHRDLLDQLDALPPDQRSVLLLISVEDLSYAQAAAVLGVPIGTVMSRLSRGRERLRRTMESDAPAHGAPYLRRVQ